MRNLTFWVLFVTTISAANAQTSGSGHGADSEVTLKPLTPRLDEAPAKPRTEKPVMLKGSLTIEEAIRSEPNLDWASWAKKCAEVISKALEGGVPSYVEAPSFEIVIFPFGLMTTRPREFRPTVDQSECPPFPEGTSIQRLIISVNVDEDRSKLRENFGNIMEMMKPLINGNEQQGASK